jgi:hypothetical protein
MNDCAVLLPRRRRAGLPKDVTSQATLRCYADGHVSIVGLALDQARLPEVVRLIGGAALTNALPAPDGAAANVTAAPSGIRPGYPTSGVRSLEDADPAEFAAARIQPLAMGWISSRAAWTEYLQFASERGLRPVSVFSYCDALRAFGLRSERHRPNGGKGKQERGWRGGQLLTDAPQLRLVGD